MKLNLTDAQWLSLLDGDCEDSELEVCCANVSALRDEFIEIVRQGRNSDLMPWQLSDLKRTLKWFADGHTMSDTLKLVCEQIGFDPAAEEHKALVVEHKSADSPRKDKATAPGSWVIICGNIVDGIEVVGEFADHDAANQYGDSVLRKEDWIVAELKTPEIVHTSEPGVWIVDLPRVDRSCEEVGQFESKVAAIKWIREHVDFTCDHEGKISLLTRLDCEE